MSIVEDIVRAARQRADAAIERALLTPGRWDVHVWTWMDDVDETHLRSMTATRLVASSSTAENWLPTVVNHKHGERPDEETS